MADAAPLPDWTIATDDVGTVHAVGDGPSLSVVGGRAFKRNGIKVPGGRHVRWLVGELDGVRVYVVDGNLVMTREDLWP